MKFCEINTTKYPKIYVNFNSDNPSEEDVNQYLSDMTLVYKSYKNIVVIYTSDKIKYMMATNRIKIGTWLKENAPTIKIAALGVAYVSKNILSNIVLKGIFLIKSPEWPNKICSSIEDAEKWADQLIKNREE